MFRRAAPLTLAGILLACGGTSTSSSETADPSGDAAPAATPSPTAGDTADVQATADAPSPDTAGPVESAPAATATPTEGTGTAPPATDVVVPEALQLSAPLVGGGEIELGALAGRPVLLWFWAPW